MRRALAGRKLLFSNLISSNWQISDWVKNTLHCIQLYYDFYIFSPRCQLYEPQEFKNNAAVGKVQNPDISSSFDKIILFLTIFPCSSWCNYAIRILFIINALPIFAVALGWKCQRRWRDWGSKLWIQVKIIKERKFGALIVKQ